MGICITVNFLLSINKKIWLFDNRIFQWKLDYFWTNKQISFIILLFIITKSFTKHVNWFNDFKLHKFINHLCAKRFDRQYIYSIGQKKVTPPLKSGFLCINLYRLVRWKNVYNIFDITWRPMKKLSNNYDISLYKH